MDGKSSDKSDVTDLATISTVQTAAEQAAARNWVANMRAIAGLQPRIAALVENVSVEMTWIYGRDGSLTARGPETWFNECSLPMLAARELFGSVQIAGTCGCFLEPRHAAQIRSVLDRIEPTHALIALVPELEHLRIFFSCEDFSAEISAHRLFFVAGAGWEAELEQLLTEQPGLPIPATYVRTNQLTEDRQAQLSAGCGRVLGKINQARVSLIDQLRTQAAKSDSICLIAPTHFRLWNDAGFALLQILQNELSIAHCDPDDPLRAGPFALAQAASGCRAIVSANIARADLPSLVSDQARWITWITTGTIPKCVNQHDALLLADAAWEPRAVDAGWSKSRLVVATWPTMLIEPTGKNLVLLGDVTDLAPPHHISNYSSHRLLWEQIASAIQADPFVLGDDPIGFVRKRMKNSGIAEGVDIPTFFDRLMIPAWRIGIARLLREAALPVKVFGAGWKDADAEPLGDRAAFEQAVRSARALVHPMPLAGSHPVESLNRPIVRPARSKSALTKAAQAALASQPSNPRIDALSLEKIRNFLS